MKKINLLVSFLCLFLFTQVARAQEKVEIDGEDVGSWFARNWMWVAGAVVLLLLIIIFSGGSRGRSKTTTVVRDNQGNVKKVTTTEIDD